MAGLLLPTRSQKSKKISAQQTIKAVDSFFRKGCAIKKHKHTVGIVQLSWLASDSLALY